MQNLSERLKLIASLVTKGAKVCDVGTDHGYLAIYLSKSAVASSVIATDIREKPLMNAKSNIVQSGSENISLRLCDGLCGVKEGEADTVIIAGMGGEVISGIIDRCPWIKKDGIRLILQPMTSPEILRKYLCDNGFSIKTEPALEENGKLYSVILAEYVGRVHEYPPYFYYIGKIDLTEKNGRAYAEKQLRRCRQCAEALSGIENRTAECLYYKKIVRSLEELLNGI